MATDQITQRRRELERLIREGTLAEVVRELGGFCEDRARSLQGGEPTSHTAIARKAHIKAAVALALLAVDLRINT